MNFEAASNETFQILRSYDYEVVLYDEDGAQVFEPEEARRFFAKPKNMLIAIIDDGDDSQIRLNLSKSTKIPAVMGLINALRTMATKYNLVFRVKKYERELAPKDFATKASVSEGKLSKMNIVEGMYGTSRSSYLKLENARMIVRHSARINENMLGARGRNIDSIYIENGVGERYLFPTTQLAPARAMTHHVDCGGSWADAVGAQIARMAADFANLGSASRHIGVYGTEMSEGAHEVREKVRESMREMRRTFESLCRKTRYADMAKKLEEMGTTLVEGETVDYSAKIGELGEMLNTEAVSLSEGVLESVARVLEGRPDPEAHLEFIGVLGRKVNKTAWEEFKSGTLELMGSTKSYPPVTSREPLSLHDKAVKVSFRLSDLAMRVKDNSLSNLFAHISEALPDARGRDFQVMFRVAKAALERAGEFSSELDMRDAGVAKTPAVAAYAEWVNDHSTTRKLAEQDRFPESDEEGDSQMQDDADDLSVTEEGEVIDLASARRERAAQKFLDADAEFADFIQGDDEDDAMDSDDIEWDEHGDERNWDWSFGDEEEEVDENCGKCIYDDVDAAEVAELSQEDVLLPVNQGEDLKNEVTKHTVTDPDTGEEVKPDDAYIDRLRSLSGMR